MKLRKKLIEVALPLEAINLASVRDKSIRHGHPSTLHLWWARRPLAAARAVIFAQTVDDPSEYVDTLRSDARLRRKAESLLNSRQRQWQESSALSERAIAAGINAPEPGPEPQLDEILAELERDRLFKILERLVLWESTNDETVLQPARDEIWQSWRRTCADNADHPRAKELFNRHKLPAFHDPFAGGGTLPLEAQRLGLDAYASDLNPVAVLINKAMIEIPPRFADRPPVNSKARSDKRLVEKQWKGAQGLAEDVRFYGQWMRSEAEKRIGSFYPKVRITADTVRERPDLEPYLGRELTVIAWLWARTVKSPNPAFGHVDVPLVSTFMLATKPGKEAYVEPILDGDCYRFEVKAGKPANAEIAKNGTKLSNANFRCVLSGTPISGDYIKAEAQANRMGARLMAIVLEGDRGRVYLSPLAEHEILARQAIPKWKPDVEFLQQALGFRVGNYGMTKWSDLFTNRQLVALTTFSDLVSEARELIRQDAAVAGLSGEEVGLEAGGIGAQAYAEAVSVYLACGNSRSADFWSSLCIWANQPKNELVTHLFGRHAIPMAWDFGEVNPFSQSGGNYTKNLSYVALGLDFLPARGIGSSRQGDAGVVDHCRDRIVSTDPPYYDNIGYADLSDYFYVWLRRSLRECFPDLFSTLTVPKAEELVATPHRHGGREHAEKFFLVGMTKAMRRLSALVHPAFPVTIYYAFKQSENENDAGAASTGWETFLDAVNQAGFSIAGTWPLRTERAGRLRDTGSNALATSVLLVCRTRPASAPSATRREFLAELKAELPPALANLQRGNIAPVDLAQAAIGPGMAVFTRYSKVVDAQDNPLSVRDALALINETLDRALAEQEGDFDADSRWAVAWFEQNGFNEGEFGIAETLSKAKNTSVDGLAEAGILESKRGKVRLLRPEELPADWDPRRDTRLTAWEVVHHLVRLLGGSGEQAAANLATRLGSKAEVARELAYRLYNICERKKRASEALAYNGLVQSFPEIIRLSQQGYDQGDLFAGTQAG